MVMVTDTAARGDPETDAMARMLEFQERQLQTTEEIRDQFAEHLELQRQLLRLLMAERR